MSESKAIDLWDDTFDSKRVTNRYRRRFLHLLRELNPLQVKKVEGTSEVHVSLDDAPGGNFCPQCTFIEEAGFLYFFVQQLKDIFDARKVVIWVSYDDVNLEVVDEIITYDAINRYREWRTFSSHRGCRGLIRIEDVGPEWRKKE